MKFELKPYNNNVSDDELISDLQNVAMDLNTDAPKMSDYNNRGKYSSGTIMRRFNGWNNALVIAGLRVNTHHAVTEVELYDDILKIADQIKPQKLTQQAYQRYGKYGVRTIQQRIGWNRALKKLGLETTLEICITDKELFNNIENLWILLGKQPGKRDLTKPNSNYSERPYTKRFESWRKALEAFVDYINSTDNAENNNPDELKQDIKTPIEEVYKHKTKRDISNSLKVRVLMRDLKNGRIKCSLCGIPLCGPDIHYDHIKPWNKGGETVLENIQILCKPHNLSKSDYYWE